MHFVKYLFRVKRQIAMPLLTEQELGGIPFASALMRFLSMDKVNDLYDRYCGLNGPAFTRAVLMDLGVRFEIKNMEVLDSLPDGPFITISNHPYGHIDGIILVDLFGHLRRDYKVMVNKILGRIEPLQANFISVTPVGAERTPPTATSMAGVRDVLKHVREGHPIGLFPAGAVSDLSIKERRVRDREWQEPVIRLIKKLDVPILPVTFNDRNSAFYYTLGLLDWRIRLLRLPSEVFNKRGKTIRVSIGNIISPEEQEEFNDLDDFRQFLRNKVYELK